MPTYRLSQAAELLGVSDDTVRRWVDAQRLAAQPDGTGRLVIEGVELARFVQALAESEQAATAAGVKGHSVRNRLTGLVTRVVRDQVMAQVELQVGSHRIVSLISREAADELGLEPGVLATACVKSTNVSIEIPDRSS